MKKLLKLIIVLACINNSISIHANSSSAPREPVILQRDDNQQGNDHLPHRSPSKDGLLPVVLYDSGEKTITFSSLSSSPYSFYYKIIDSNESVVTEGTVEFNETHEEETIDVYGVNSGIYTIIIVINGNDYKGYLGEEE